MKKSTKQSSTSWNEFIDTVRTEIQQSGFVQTDKRLNRKTKTLVGYNYFLSDPKTLAYLRSIEQLPKYEEDWKRMRGGFIWVTGEAKKDPSSRRLVFYNTDEYYKTFQCFNLFQFVKNETGDFTLAVYQRSSDFVKLADDAAFFANVASRFTDSTGCNVSTINVTVGNLHKEV